MLDLHCHLMPGVDDGAGDVGEALGALRTMQEQGVQAVIATPHVDASLTRHPTTLGYRLQQLDTAWRALTNAARAEFPDLRLERGAEVMLDTPMPILMDDRLRLAGTSFALVEFSGLVIPPGAATVLRKLLDAGVRPLIAHPERYTRVMSSLEELEAWRGLGCTFQVNCGSLVGRYGSAVTEASLGLLERGWIDYLASDFHARGFFPLNRCAALLEDLEAEEQAELLLRANPARLLANEAPEPVPPLQMKQKWWEKLLGR